MRTILIFLVMAIALGGALAPAADEAAPIPRSIIIGKNGLATNPPAQEGTTTPDASATKSIEELAGTAAPAAEAAPAPAIPAVDLSPIVQAMQLMIDQQKLALQSMEQTRAETVEGAKRSGEALDDKMSKLEKTLAAQRAKEAEAITRMNRLVFGIAAGFSGTGFVVMILTAWFFMRTMNKITEINANIQSQLLALPHTQTQLVGNGAGNHQPGNQRLLGALEQLERRIRDLEHTSTSSHGETPSGTANTKHAGSLGAETVLVNLEAKDEDDSPSVGALMAKGQTLLNLDDAAQALECFAAVLQKEPHNADALLKKGTALERLRRNQEAIDAYDAALQEDDSLTMAYLAKGGICNRLERYAEALECYERALRVQQQSTA